MKENMIRKIGIFIFVICFNVIVSQTPIPSTTVFGVPVANQAVNSYTQASLRINLTATQGNGFHYGNANGAQGSVNLWNLSISNYPLNQAFNPDNNIAAILTSNYVDPSADPFPGFNNQLEYGVTGGSYAVSQNGEFLYNIPIICSPGTKGIEPNMAISYNSQGYNGLLGIGWGLSGISSITRGSKTAFDNGMKSPITVTNADNFLLDGKILIPFVGNNGENQTTYSFEQHDFSEITSFGPPGGTPTFFRVRSKNGTVVEYGNSATSKLFGSGDNTVFSWYISRVQDEFGNYMVYNYTNLSGEILLESIDYTGNIINGNPTYNSIKFEYMNKADANKIYEGGRLLNSTKMLKSISCYDLNNTVIKKYVMQYKFDLYTELYKITEIDKNGNQLNPTIINWGEQNGFHPQGPIFANTNINNSIGFNNLKGIKAADINGDGYSDIVAFSDKFINSNHNTSFYQLSNYWGEANNPFQYQLPFEFSDPGPSPILSQVNYRCLGMFSYDGNDDNKDEVAAITTSSTSPGNLNYKVAQISVGSVNSSWYSGNQTHPIDQEVFNVQNYENPNALPSPFFHDVNDYTGDGIKDHLITDQQKLTLTDFSNSQTFTFPYPDRLTVVKTGDFNGDGKLEIFVISKSSVSVSSYFVQVLSFNPSTSTFVQLDNKMLILNANNALWGQAVGKNFNFLNNIDVGDVNGDGKSDLVYFLRGAQGLTGYKRLFVYPSNGLTFDALIPMFIPSSITTQIVGGIPVAVPTLDDKDIVLSLRDVNYDNKADVILANLWAQDQATGLFTVQINSTYSVYTSSGFALNYLPLVESYAGGTMLDFGDYNGDGTLDIFRSHPLGDAVNLYAYNQKRNHFVRSIENAKETVEAQYCFIQSEVDYNSKHKIYEPEVGQPNYKPPMYVTNYVKSKNIEYRYSYGRGTYFSPLLAAPVNGVRGFSGFGLRKVVNLNDLTGTVTKQVFSQTHRVLNQEIATTGKVNLAFLPIPVIYKYNLADVSNSYTSTNNYVNVTGLPNRVVYNAVLNTTSKNYMNSVFFEETQTYDQAFAGNLIQSVKDYLQSGGIMKTITNNYTYQFSNIFRLTQQVSSATTYGQGATVYSRQKNYLYDNLGRLVLSVDDQNIPSVALSTSYSNFNPYGDPGTIEISAPDISNRTIQFLYDNTGRFPIKKINSINDFEDYTYEPSFGNVTSAKSISGLITNYKYDGLGRVIEIDEPNLTINKRKYEWDVNASPFNGSYSLTVTNQGAPQVIYLYNEFDNLLNTTAQGFGGINIISNCVYNASNRLIVEEEPHFVNQTKFKVNTFQYESAFFRKFRDFKFTSNLGNLIPDGFVEYSYNTLSTDAIYNKGFVQVQHPSGNKLKQENNVVGQMDKVYNYPANSNIARITDYTIHANGQPTRLKNSFPDASNSESSFTYDSRGYQISLNDQSTGLTTYNYNSVGQLTIQTLANGNNFTFSYDLLDRLTSKIGNISGATTYQYVTAPAGREQIEKITGPNSVTDFKYDNLNRQIEVKETIGNKVFKTECAFDQLGNQTDYIYPSGYTLKKEFDNIGNLLRIKNGNTIIWECNSYNTVNQIGQYTYGNGIVTNINLDNNRNLSEIIHGGFHKQEYTIDPFNHNIVGRKFTHYPSPFSILEEQFIIDGEQRLNQVQKVQNQNLITTLNVNYKDNGAITTKSDAGNYVYNNPNKPYTLTSINNLQNNISLNTLNVSYNDFNKVSLITESSNPNPKQMNFIYGNNDERLQVDYSIGGVNSFTRYYLQNYDREENQSGYKEWNYIYSPSGLAAMYYNNNGVGQLLYALTDHLGSPIMLTNQNQQIVEEYSFDAWGRRRNPINWTFSGVPVPQYMIRGFTMHEHIDEFGLINMNGRVYDPVIGTFIQPDNFVQAPNNLQNFNRYAYCFNNPLKYTDLTGNWAGWDDLIVTGGGFAIGYVGYGLTTGDWGAKAVVAGAAVAVFAEISYLTLGGGAGATAAAFTSGQSAVSGLSFLGNLTVDFGFTMFQNKDQIKAASANDSWNGVVLTSGYGLSSALSAGFKTKYAKNELFGGDNTLRKGVSDWSTHGVTNLMNAAYNEGSNSWGGKHRTVYEKAVGYTLVRGLATIFGEDFAERNYGSLSPRDKLSEHLTKNFAANYSKDILYDAVLLWDTPPGQRWDNLGIFKNLYTSTLFNSIYGGFSDKYSENIINILKSKK